MEIKYEYYHDGMETLIEKEKANADWSQCDKSDIAKHILTNNQSMRTKIQEHNEYCKKAIQNQKTWK